MPLNRGNLLLWKVAVWLATQREVPLKFNYSSLNEVRYSFVHFSLSFSDDPDNTFLVAFPATTKGLLGHFCGIYKEHHWVISAENWKQPTACVPVSMLGEARVDIEEIHGPISIQHESLSGFLLSRLLFATRFGLLAKRIDFYRFNQKFRFTTERMEVLASIVDIQRKRVDETTQRRSIKDEFLATTLFTEKYSSYAWQRSDTNKNLDELRFVLESLVESGDLTTTTYGYRLTGKSLQTLAHHEEDNRRNRISERNNSAAIALSTVITFATLAQAYFAYNDWRATPTDRETSLDQ